MANKIKWTKEFWQEWIKNPQQFAKKQGWNWGDADLKWKNWSSKEWGMLSQGEVQAMLQKSKWAGWIWWE